MTTGPQPGDSERNVADHVRAERESKGWSTAELARRVTAAGCPISQSAVWRIENGEPRRKISVDELVAFSTVFGKPIDDLLQPMSDEYPEQLVDVYVREWLQREREAWLAKSGVFTALMDLAAIASAFPAATPHLPEIVRRIIERDGLGFLQGEVTGKLPEISSLMGVRVGGVNPMSNPTPLIEFWKNQGLKFEEMVQEAKRLRLGASMFTLEGGLRSLFDEKASVAEKLQAAREVSGQSIFEIAEAAGIEAEVVTAMEAGKFLNEDERGEHALARERIRILASALGLNADALVAQYDAEVEQR